MKRFYCAAAALFALALAGCHRDVKEPVPSPPVSPSETVSPTPKASPGEAVIFVLNPKATGNDDPLMARTISLSHPELPLRSAINALLRDPNSPFPPGTALRGITVDSGLARLDFSRSPVNETGGEGGQGQALTALGRTLGEFPEIEKFQILVKGRLVTTFGEFTTDGPIDVTRPEAKS